MAESSIIKQQRDVVRSVQALVDDHLQQEAEAENRLRLDREAADLSLSQARAAADAELRRAFALLQEADRLAQPRGDRAPLAEIVPTAPPKLFDTDVLLGIQIMTAQMEARLIRIRASFGGGASTNLITMGIILGAVVAAIAILVMPFMSGSHSPSWSYGWFGAIVSPLLVAMLVAGARATILRPYSPDEDYRFIRGNMGYALYMHQVFSEEARSTHERRLNERQQRFDEARERVGQSFRQHLAMLQPLIAAFESAADACGPEWAAPTWRTWTPSSAMPRVTCVGEMTAGIREDRVTLPALVPFPHERALIVKADTHARARAIAAIQSILLRLVATVPPGELRFILIDPLGQGQHVAPFTPFADVGIGLGEGRAWSEPHQIEQRLHDLVSLVESAEDVGPLRPRLDASSAKRVAEPTRVLVMLDFPSNVSGATARLLTTLIQKGPACGIHPLVMVDMDIPMPYGVNMHDIEMLSTTLTWDGRRFVWQDSEFRSAWIELDKPPSAALAKQLIRDVRAAVEPVTRSA